VGAANVPTMSEAQSWRESFAAERIPWLAEYAYRSLLRVPIRRAGTAQRIGSRIDRALPTTTRVFPARVNGVVLSVRLDDRVARPIFYGRGPLRYELHTTKLLLEELKPSDVFLDGGTSWGWYTALAVNRVGLTGFVYGVEANRERARVLADDLRRAGVTNSHVVPCALGDAPGRSTLGRPFSEANESQYMVGTSADGRIGDDVEIDVITIDMLHLPRLDLVKLDVEGSEVAALLGATATLRRCRPRLLLIEAMDENLARRGSSLEHLAAVLDAADYTHEDIHIPAEEAAPMWACRPKEA